MNFFTSKVIAGTLSKQHLSTGLTKYEGEQRCILKIIHLEAAHLKYLLKLTLGRNVRDSKTVYLLIHVKAVKLAHAMREGFGTLQSS